MKIAYVTNYDPYDVSNWSGLGYYILQALKTQPIDIELISCLDDDPRLTLTHKFLRVKQLFYKLQGKLYRQHRDYLLVRSYAKQIEEKLAAMDVDLVFCPSSYVISEVRCKQPIVYWSDTTVAGLLGFYPEWSNLCQETINHSNRQEQQALSNCRFALYSSDWAAQSAVRDYVVDSSKVKMVPFGANIECDRTLGDVKTMIAQRSQDVCRLLLVGVDWYRKGTDFAVNVAKRLNALGIRTELTVVGCEAPDEVPDFVKVLGFISKRTPAGRETLDKLYSESHFFILPSRAECAAVSLAEACSFGVPVIASDVGGITTIVQNNVNGIALPLENFVEQSCDFILKYRGSEAQYQQLAQGTFADYEKRLTWDVAARTVRSLLENLLNSTATTVQQKSLQTCFDTNSI